LTQDFAISAWFSTEARASVMSSTQALETKLVETMVNGTVELPSSQNMLPVNTIALSGQEV
jgi:hypothetical protein